MPHRALKSLADIRDAAEFILAVTADETENSYRQNRLLRQAIERSFEIIGEAMRRLRDSDPDFLRQFSDAQRIIGLSDRLISEYDRISDETVWLTIQQYLPTLLVEIQPITARLRGEAPDSQ